MKKLVSMFVGTLLLFSCFTGFATVPITVELDCCKVEFAQDPVIQNDRTLVAVRPIFEALGATVDWDSETQTVTSVLKDTTVVMKLNNDIMTINGAFKTLDVAPQLINGSTMVPTRAVTEGFGCTVEWDGANRTVRIFSQEFLARVAAQESFSSVKKLKQGEVTAISAFGIPYFRQYETKTELADGTAIEVGYTTETGHASLAVRSDIYIGEDARLTDAYVKQVAESMVSVVSGTLISSRVVLLSDMEFIKIEYTAPRIVHGITDYDPLIVVYMGRKGGVMYTLTHSTYGEVPRSVTGDFNYMINALLIA